MKRLQISLEPELDEALGKEAAREGISKAEVVRQCLRQRVETVDGAAEDPILQMFGSGVSGGLRPGETIDDVLYGPIADRSRG